jgi:glycosyltransferase involved in cell wall biosynthesis
MLLAQHVDSEIFTTHVCTFTHGDLVDQLNELGVVTTVIPLSHSLVHFVKLISFLRKNAFDVVHCHSGGYACLAAKIAGNSCIVYTKHGVGFTQEELLRRTLVRRLRDWLVDRCVDRYIAVTQHDKEIMVRVLKLSSKKIEVIYNGIDPPFVRAKSSKGAKRPVIGVVGRLTKQKGISYLLEAVPTIIERFGNLRVLIVGSGEEEVHLKNMTRKLGITASVEFTGYTRRAAELIAQMDVFVLPSIWEGFPYVLLEAMMLKKPIVASGIFGIMEIIENERTGILVAPRDTQSIANAVLTLLTDENKAQTLGHAAYERAIKNFTLHQTTSNTERLYRSLVRTVLQ